LRGFAGPDRRFPIMSDALKSSVFIRPQSISAKHPKVVPTAAMIAQDAADPTKDPAWSCFAALHYGPAEADPYEAYKEFYEREREQGAA
jgi:hypothetical protein